MFTLLRFLLLFIARVKAKYHVGRTLVHARFQSRGTLESFKAL